MRGFAFALALCAFYSVALAAPDDVLNKPVKEVRFEKVALADVLTFLGDATKTTITADWNATRKENIDVTASVSIQAKDSTLGKVLDDLLLQLSPEKKLTYTVDKDTIEITTKAALGK